MRFFLNEGAIETIELGYERLLNVEKVPFTFFVLNKERYAITYVKKIQGETECSAGFAGPRT